MQPKKKKKKTGTSVSPGMDSGPWYVECNNRKSQHRDFPGGPVVKIRLPMQGM